MESLVSSWKDNTSRLFILTLTTGNIDIIKRTKAWFLDFTAQEDIFSWFIK